MQSCRLQHRNGHTGHPIILVIQNADFPRPLLFTPALKSGRKAMKRQQNFCRIVSDQSRESIMIRSPEAIQPLLPICAVVAGHNMTVTSDRQQSRRLFLPLENDHKARGSPDLSNTTESPRQHLCYYGKAVFEPDNIVQQAGPQGKLYMERTTVGCM